MLSFSLNNGKGPKGLIPISCPVRVVTRGARETLASLFFSTSALSISCLVIGFWSAPVSVMLSRVTFFSGGLWVLACNRHLRFPRSRASLDSSDTLMILFVSGPGVRSRGFLRSPLRFSPILYLDISLVLSVMLLGSTRNDWSGLCLKCISPSLDPLIRIRVSCFNIAFS